MPNEGDTTIKVSFTPEFKRNLRSLLKSTVID